MLINKPGMAWSGRVTEIHPIPNADKIQQAVVVCGDGGRWSGVVGKDINVGNDVIVYLPDAVIPPSDSLAFMEKYGWRVRQQRLRGCPSEVLIVLPTEHQNTGELGTDLTEQLGVQKYEKDLPYAENVAGHFPAFLRKTDEHNYQKVPKFRIALEGREYYASVKYDGTSQTFFHKDGEFGVCSRNYQLKENEFSPAFVLADRYDLKRLAKYGNLALQWECVGPKIQNNPLKLPKYDLRLFDVWDIDKQDYWDYHNMFELSKILSLPTAKLVELMDEYPNYDDDDLRQLADGKYDESNTPREGIVVRPTYPLWVEDRGQRHRVSFKVINLNYKEA